MSIFKTEYVLNVEKSIDKCRELFEKSFKNMGTAGYSSSTVIHHPSYGMKKFSGTVDNGIYKARLIISHETDSFYRSALLNEISFTGNETGTKVKVSVKTTKFAFTFFGLLVTAMILLAAAVLFVGDTTIFIAFIASASVMAFISLIPLVIARHRVNEAKETLIYILKYADN